ncbi:hypothetical protein ABDK96_15930 [Citricoccus nitrophenolicus]|uniref:DNA modification methylase n=1 Tax=Citricoccus nitrophenolicus TaxID=863575 RepID=A0ABV0ILZ2_9MICC|nr:hypothetical protein [Citricoccus sp. I39-566]WMY79441.1 hypothetical protein RE421_06150 [Citricoccus sp. I39-566]
MKFAASKATVRKASVAGLAAVALLGATGCSAINQQATTLQYAPSDGIVANVGDAELRNIALITAAPDAEARYIGTLSSDSGEPLEVSITVAGTQTRFNVPAEESLILEDPANEQIIPSAGRPGTLVDATVEVDGESETVGITILDGTLEEYREFVPGGADPDADDHLYATPAAEEGGH